MCSEVRPVVFNLFFEYSQPVTLPPCRLAAKAKDVHTEVKNVPLRVHSIIRIPEC